MKHQIIRNHFKKNDPTLFSYIQKIDFDDWLKPEYKRSKDYFTALTRDIVGQQLSGKAANTIFERFTKLFANNTPTPESVLNLGHDELRSAGLSRAKASYVQNIAQAVVNGELSLTSFDTLSDDQIIEQLVKIKGVGNWTAEMFLMFTLGREDVFSFGDLGLKKGIAKVYGLENPSKENIETIIQRWKPYKTFGSFALWFSLEN